MPASSPTKPDLAALGAAGRIGADDAAALSEAYVRLRTIEHRVQMIEDHQTHDLPSGASLDRLARLHGLVDGDGLLSFLAPHVERVAAVYDGLVPDPVDHLSGDEALLTEQLAGFGLVDCEAAAGRIDVWRSGRYRALRSPAARDALESVLPALTRALAEAPDPRGALIGFDRLFERLPSAINIFRLLDARPGLIAIVATILSQAPTLAADLALNMSGGSTYQITGSGIPVNVAVSYATPTSAAYTSGTANFAASGSGYLSVGGTACGSSGTCSASIQGFFAGQQAQQIGLGYSISDPVNSRTVNGAAAFGR